MLLNKGLGSELFLGVVLTDAELRPDAPTTEHCGRCTACLDECPTHAFPEPRVLDARLCVGYLTVEHRASIPEPLHGGMGTMAAGCDICQEVCPWTIRAPANLHQEYSPAPHRFKPRLEDLERFDEDGFRRWRAGSPITRIPFSHFKYVLEIIRTNLTSDTP
jgi:epoxyqueuosine reductase